MAGCINCGQEIPPGQELCENCSENLDKMVDARAIGQEKYEVRTSDAMNPFYSSTHLAGGVVSPDKDQIESIAAEEDGYGSFFKVIGVIVILMAFMLRIFLG